MKTLSIVVAVLVVFPQCRAWGQLFIEPAPGLPAQTAKEAQFLAALPSYGAVLDFEDPNLAADPTGIPIPGQPWAPLGVTLAGAGNAALTLRETAYAAAAHSGTRFVNAAAFASNEDMSIHLSPPATAVSLWLIDSEVNNASSDRIRFLAPDGSTLLDLAMPINGGANVGELGVQGNLFIGIISPTPIARVLLVESTGDQDGIGFDDLHVVPIGAPTFPGSDEGLLLRSAVGFVAPSAVPFDVKSATALDLLTINLTSQVTTSFGLPVILAAEAFATGSAAPSLAGLGLPQVHLSLVSTVVLVGAPSPVGPPVLPYGGLTTSFVVPPGLAGTSVLFQGFVATPMALNGFIASDAHKIVIN